MYTFNPTDEAAATVSENAALKGPWPASNCITLSLPSMCLTSEKQYGGLLLEAVCNVPTTDFRGSNPSKSDLCKCFLQYSNPRG